MWKQVSRNIEIISTLVLAAILIIAIVALFGYLINQVLESFVDIGQTLNWEVHVEAECLRLGYPESKVTYGEVWEGYCTKIIDGSSVTVPLSELQGGQ